MKTILSQIEAATMLARDWHYNASGLSFYAEHLLADKVAEIGDHSDKLIETYYLGERETVPPAAGDITRGASLMVFVFSEKNSSIERLSLGYFFINS